MNPDKTNEFTGNAGQPDAMVPRLFVANALLLSAFNEALALRLELSGRDRAVVAELRELASQIRERVDRIRGKERTMAEESRALADFMEQLLKLDARNRYSRN